VQEFCNALFDALLDILPLGTDMDKVDPTPSKLHVQLPWMDEAKALLDRMLEQQPVLVRICAAKRMRDRAERNARRAGAATVTVDHVVSSRTALADGEPA